MTDKELQIKRDVGMTIYDLEKQATPMPWEVSKEGDAWLPGEVFVKGSKSIGCCWEQADTELVAHCRNHFMEALKALKHDVDPRWVCHSDECEANPTDEELETSTEPHEERCDCWVSKRRDLIAKLEEVK